MHFAVVISYSSFFLVERIELLIDSHKMLERVRYMDQMSCLLKGNWLLGVTVAVVYLYIG
jgi:hypothetical protein